MDEAVEAGCRDLALEGQDHLEGHHQKRQGSKSLAFQSIIDRFEAQYIPEPNSGCWLWIGSISGRNNYGAFSVHGKDLRAHRFSYELYKGKIPKGLVLDHLCRITICVNPDHLEAVTQKENVRRGKTYGKRSLVCPNGHPRTKDNIYRLYFCKECRRITNRRWRARAKIQ